MPTAIPSASMDPKLISSNWNCTRERLLGRYLADGQRSPSQRFDHYQFGVPTRMDSVASVLPGYTTYWGFDSFIGLPDEQEDQRGNVQWTRGRFSLACHNGLKIGKMDEHGGGECGGKQGRENAIALVAHQLRAHKRRMELVPGFYNESLTETLASKANPAWYVDVNCDLYTSSIQALTWLFRHRLVRPGTLIMYDDWFNAPFGKAESQAHMEATRRFGVSFRLLYRCSGRKATVKHQPPGNLVLFQVDAVAPTSQGSDGVVEELKNFQPWMG